MKKPTPIRPPQPLRAAAIQQDPVTPREWVMFAAKAASEAAQAAAEAEDGDPAAVGRDTYLAHMPILDSRANTQAYIACIAGGIAMGVISPVESQKLLYLAQTALAGFRDGAHK